MSTAFSARVDFPADPATTYELVADQSYVTDVAAATGGSDIEVTVTRTDDGGAVVTSQRSLPADVPSYARAFVGDTLRLTEVRRYGPSGADGTRRGVVEGSFDGVPVRIRGTLLLHGSPDGSVIEVQAEVSASVPLVGGRIEQLAIEQVQAYLAKENEVALARLS